MHDSHSRTTRRNSLFIALICAGVATGPAAADYIVADGDVAGLIAAINAANAAPDRPAVIHLAKNGNYTLTEVYTEEFYGPTGLPAIGTEITINANGATISRSAEPGTPQFRIMIVIGPSDGLDGKLTLNDATITGAVAPNGAAGVGNSGTLVIDNCIITNNVSALNGGGVGNAFGGFLTVIDSTISDNTATIGGGGIINFSHGGSATVINTAIRRNSAGIHGGGVDTLRPMAIIDSIIEENTGGSNGGGIATSHELTLTNTIIRDNATLFSDEGGGIWVEFGPAEVGHSDFCSNDPDNISGEFIDLGGNSFLEECETKCPPTDLNCDGIVDVFDLLILLGQWGECAGPDDCPADLNDDGVVDVFDLLILLSNWG